MPNIEVTIPDRVRLSVIIIVLVENVRLKYLFIEYNLFLLNSYFYYHDFIFFLWKFSTIFIPGET